MPTHSPRVPRLILLAGAIMSSVAIWSPAIAQTPRTCLEANEGEVLAFIDRWHAAITAGRPDAVAELYADDAVLLPAESETPRKGKAAIRAYFAEFNDRHPALATTMRSVMAGCGMASEMGMVTFRITGQRKGTRMLVGGRTTTVLAHRDGRWLIVHQSLSLVPQPNRRIALAP